MQRMLIALLVAGVVSFAGVSTARAQSSNPVLVKVPFQFIVGDKVFPAGSYRVTSETDDASVLLISSVDGRPMAAFVTTDGGRNASIASGANVTFKTFGGHYFLAQIAVPGENLRTVSVSKASAEQTLAKLNLAAGEPANSAK